MSSNIKNTKFMKRKSLIINLISPLFLAMLCNGCGYGDCGDNNHYSTSTLSNGIYVEKYRCFCGGATTTDLFYVYLSDSISFRKYIGIEDFPYEIIIPKSRNDSMVDVYIKTDVNYYKQIKEDVDVYKEKYETKLDKSYNINTLKKKNKFDEPCKKR
jgi:hypothetical protein